MIHSGASTLPRAEVHRAVMPSQMAREWLRARFDTLYLAVKFPRQAAQPMTCLDQLPTERWLLTAKRLPDRFDVLRLMLSRAVTWARFSKLLETAQLVVWPLNESHWEVLSTQTITLPEGVIASPIKVAPSSTLGPDQFAAPEGSEWDPSWTNLDHIAGIEAWPQLETVTLNGTLVTDVSPLSALPKLRHLHIAQAEYIDLSTVPTAKLSTLQITLHRPEDAALLSQCPALKTLILNDTQNLDLAPVAPLTGLQSLSLHRVTLPDLAPIAKLPQLHTLSLVEAKIEQLRVPPSVRQLHLGAAEWTQLTLPPQLEGLFLSDTVFDATRISEDPKLSASLKALDLNGTTVSTLPELPQVRTLNISDTPITRLPVAPRLRCSTRATVSACSSPSCPRGWPNSPPWGWISAP